jgi:hypothetical protein
VAAGVPLNAVIIPAVLAALAAAAKEQDQAHLTQQVRSTRAAAVVAADITLL